MAIAESATDSSKRYYPKKKKKKLVTPAQQNAQGRGGMAPSVYKPVYVPPKLKKPAPTPKEYKDLEAAGRENPRISGYFDENGELKDKTTEGKVTVLTDMYFRDSHSLPDHQILASMMMSKNGPRTQEQHEALWGPIMDAMEGDENDVIHAGDIFQLQDDQDSQNKIATAFGVKPSEAQRIRNSQIDWKTAKEHMDYVLHLKSQRVPGTEDYYMAAGQVGKFRSELHDRLSRRKGMNVNFSKLGDKYDPDFELGVRRYIFSRQLAYAVFGTPEQQAKANAIIEKIRTSGGYGKDLLTGFGDKAERLGVSPQLWSAGDTAAGILGVLQNTNDDTIRSLIYDGFVFGRPMGQSERQARYEFARQFGVNRLPSRQQDLYKKDNDGVAKFMNSLGNAMSGLEDAAAKVPIIGGPLADTAELFNNATAYLQLPITYLVRGIGTVGTTLGSANNGGLTHRELMEQWSEHGGREGFEEAHPELAKGFSLGMLTDMSNWKANWDEGTDPFMMIANYWDMSGDGSMSTVANGIAQVSSFGYQFYLGAKIGDPIAYGGMKLGAVGAWKGARAVHKAGTMYYRSRPDFFGAGQRGSASVDLLVAGLTGKVAGKADDYYYHGTSSPEGVAGIDSGGLKTRNAQNGIEDGDKTYLDFFIGTKAHETPSAATTGGFGFTGGGALYRVKKQALKDLGFDIRKKADGKTVIAGHETGTVPPEYLQKWDGKGWVDVVPVKNHVFAGTNTPFRVVEDSNGDAVVVKLTRREWMEHNGGKWDDLEYEKYEGDWQKQIEKHAKDKKSPVEPHATDIHVTKPRGRTVFRAGDGDKDVLFVSDSRSHSDMFGQLQGAKLRQFEVDPDAKILDYQGGTDRYPHVDPKDTSEAAKAAREDIARKAAEDGYDGVDFHNYKGNEPELLITNKAVLREEPLGPIRSKADEMREANGEPAAPVRKYPERVMDRDMFEDPTVTTFYDPSTGRIVYAQGSDLAHAKVLSLADKAHGGHEKFRRWAGQLITITPNKWTDSGIPELIIHGTKLGDELDPKMWLRAGANPESFSPLIGKLSKSKAIDWDADVRFTRPGREGMDPEIADLIRPAHAYAKGNRGDATAIHFDDAVAELGPMIDNMPVGGQAGGVRLELLTGIGFLKRTDLPTGRVTIQPYCPPAWLSTNAELLSKVDNDFMIARMYGLPDDVDELKPIVARISKEKEPELIKPLLRELEGHGIQIDSGANATFKAIQWELERKGIGQTGWSRIFTTMTTYGKFHEIDGAADNVYNVGKAINMGIMKGDRKAAHAKLQLLAERVWKARNQDKQAIVDELWDEFEKNLGPEGLAELQEYNRSIQHARGKRYTDQLTRRSWMPGEDGKELSLVIDPNIRAKLSDAEKMAYDKYDAAFADATKALEMEIDALEKAYAPLVGATVSKGVKTKQGIKGGAELTERRKALAELNRMKSQALHPEVAQARKQIAQLAEKLGASEDDIAKLAGAVLEATRRSQKQANAAEVLARIGARKQPYAKWPKKVREEWDQAVNDMNEFASAQPFKLGQTRTHINHRYDPRVTGWFMSGKGVSDFMKADQAVFEPLMRTFKETVMASVGFPLRVNVGDEMIRLIPEGVSRKWATAGLAPEGAIGALAKELKMDKTVFSEFEERFRDSLAGDWETGNPNDWVTIMPNLADKNYLPALQKDLESWRTEPIVRHLVADARRGGKGNFPTDVKHIKAYIRRLRDKDDELGAQIRQHLEDTLRVKDEWKTVDGKHVLVKDYNTKAFDEWCDAWEDRLQAIGRNEVFRKAMVGDVDMDELTKWATTHPDELWPVNAQAVDRMDYSLTSGNPLYIAPQANPYHYVYQHVTTRMLSGIGRRLKEVVFADKYYKMRNEILAKHPNIDADELHSICAKEAMRHANQAGYSRSTTMFEDMARNMLPFVSAYRQFWAYWLKTAIKHPVSMSVVKEQYPEVLSDPFQFAAGNYQFLTPSIPFWGPTDEGGNGTLLELAKKQVPSWSFIPMLGARTMIGAFGGSAQDYAGLPTMSGLSSNMAPFKRQAQLLYGFTGLDAGVDGMDIFFGDGEKMERAHINAMLQWMKYGDHKTGATPSIDYPWWAEGLMTAFQKLPGDIKPEALYNEIMKTGSPVNIYYSPEDVRNKMNWQMEFKKLRETDEMKANKFRADHPWLDKFLRYYEVGPVQQNKMRHDPANADLLKWWQSPYNYDGVGIVLTGDDWIQNAFANGRKFKDDQQLISATHNLHTAIYGGYFMTGEVAGKKVTGGTPYAGDVPKAHAEKVYKKQTEKALEWARDVAKAMCKKNGWSDDMYEQLMWKFKNPGPVQPDGRRLGWGMWNTWTEQLDMNRYDVDLGWLEQSFQQKYGAHDQMMNTAYKPDGDKLLKAVGLMQWTTRPELARKLQNETPYNADIQTSKKDIRRQITEATTQIASNRWYYFTSDQVALLTGKKVDPRIDAAQVTLKDAWDEWHQAKTGSDAYREGRDAYYTMQKKLLGDIPGGMALVGGLGERLEHVKHFNTPERISIGAGPKADQQLTAWSAYKKIRDKELAKGEKADLDRIQEAWTKYVDTDKKGDKGATGMEGRQLENGRVRMWDIILERAAKYRAILKNSYSDYYKAKGNSAKSNFGKKYVNYINKMVNEAAAINDRFADDIDKYFDGTRNLGGKLLDWYAY